MPAIKINLSRLIELFGKSVNTVELPEPVRALAARMMTLTAHVMRIDQKVDARVKDLSEQISTLTDIIQALAQPQGAATAPPSAEAAPAPAAAPAEVQAPPIAEEEEESGEEDDFVARAQAEAAAEVAAINANAPAEPEPSPVAVLPTRGKKAGGAK